MATTLGAAVPLGYDPVLYSSNFDAPLPLLEDLVGMTAEGFGGNAVYNEEQMLGIEFDYVQLGAPVESSAVKGQSGSVTGEAAAASEAARSSSGGRVGGHSASNQSTWRAGVVESVAGGSARSPGSNSLILTPASTLLEYNASISDSNHPEEDDTDDNHSPTSIQTDSDYVHVSRTRLHPARGNLPGTQTSYMSNNRPPPSSSGASGVSDAQLHSRASSVAPSTASFSGAQWGSFPSTSSGFMDNNHPQHHAPNSQSELFGFPPSYAPDPHGYTSSGQQYSDALLSDLTAFDNSMFNNPIPYRLTDEQQQMFSQNPFTTGSPFTQGYPQSQLQVHGQANLFAQQQRQAQNLVAQQARMRDPSGGNFRPDVNIPSTDSLLVHQQTNLRTAPAEMEQTRLTPSPMHAAPSVARNSISTVTSSRNSPYPQPVSRPTPPSSTAQQFRQTQGPVGVMHQPPATAGPSNRPLQTLAKANASPTVPSNAPRSAQGGKGRRGGRQKHSHLPEQARKKSHKMRKLAACWRCALQRDPCDEGTPCGRCEMKSQKGQTYFFDCDRSKLPDFVHDFLPLQASMTLMHQKQTIEDCVNDQVLDWDLQNPIDVYLTSGYGPALRWRMYEFKPRTEELLGQFQYLQNPATGAEQRFQKYSPPFGLIKLDSVDDQHFENYLEQLLGTDYLWDFGWTCFEEETQVDPDAFQARLLQLMCQLYLDTQDTELKELLREIVRMMIITYIMGHTLTVLEETLPSVLASVKLSRPGQRLPHTSPRLANRQLKFFFAIIRTNIYEKILKWQQQTLHTSGKKEASWLPAFCAMLGFAMVLEEVQRTIQIQADAKAAKGEMTFDQANTEARYACERIDARFKLLVGLFQCKYRDKTWGENGSFGPQTPVLRNPIKVEFLRRVRVLVDEKRDLLQSRKDVQFAPENQCRYTSRLVARFLLPFLTLPRA